VASAALAGVSANEAHKLLATARSAEDLDALRQQLGISLADIK